MQLPTECERRRRECNFEGGAVSVRRKMFFDSFLGLLRYGGAEG